MYMEYLYKPKSVPIVIILWLVFTIFYIKTDIYNVIQIEGSSFNLLLFGFLTQVIVSYTSNVISPWKLNKIYNEKEVLNESDLEAQIIFNVYELFQWCDYIISISMAIDKKFDFLLAQFCADLIIKNIIFNHNLTQKTTSNKKA